ncbi:MAG: hypothetical protein KC503_13630 [Myxococcales bacterium]|nr:hypothetical protein [Myxococcales bacterium]
MATIRQREQALFRRWKKRRPDCVGDGVVDEGVYLAARPRLLFVLKEVNSPGNSDWDLRDFLAKGGRSQTWNNVTRWVEGLRRLDSDIPWSELASISDERRKQALDTIAAVNLKKDPGGSTTKAKELISAVAQDRDLLCEQIRLYDADIIIACGSLVAGQLVSVLDLPASWPSTRRGIQHCEDESGAIVFAYSHPEARVHNSLLHYGLVDAVREVWARRG